MKASKMGYAAVWKILEKMIEDLRKKGVNIPSSAIQDLQSAKSLLSIVENGKSGEILQQIDILLQNVESYAISEGQKVLGLDYSNKWLRKIGNAGIRKDKADLKQRFVSGIARSQKWIKVAPSKDLNVEEIKQLACEAGLLCKTQEDKDLLLRGNEQSINNFIKLVAARGKSRRRSNASEQ
jgi:hypothetical protein